MKKALSIALALALVITMFSGCGTPAGSSSSSPAASTSQAPASSAPSAPAQPETLGDRSIAPPGGFTPVEIVPKEKYKIAFANWNSTNAAAATFATNFQKAADYYGVELLSMDNKQDPIQAISNFENAKTWGADYYIQYNEDPEANKRIGQMLLENKIPAIGIQVPLGEGFPYYRLDPAMSGEASGTPLATRSKEVFGDDVEFFICMDCPEAGAVIQDRAAAAVKAVQAIYPDIKVITYSSEGNPEKSRQKMADVLTANPKGNFMFWGHMDQWTLAALSAIKAAGREKNCVITSIVALDMMLEELQREDSPVYGTVAIRPEVWAWELLPKAIKELNDGTKPEMDMFQPCVLITKDNLGEIYPDKVIKK